MKKSLVYSLHINATWDHNTTLVKESLVLLQPIENALLGFSELLFFLPLQRPLHKVEVILVIPLVIAVQSLSIYAIIIIQITVKTQTQIDYLSLNMNRYYLFLIFGFVFLRFLQISWREFNSWREKFRIHGIYNRK